MKILACCLGLLAWASPGGAAADPEHAAGVGQAAPQAGDFGLAPDGKRGFGSDIQPRELARLLRSDDPQDKAFLSELAQLAMTTRIVLADVQKHYEARGYFKLLSASAGDDVLALHREYERLRKHPGEVLAVGDQGARTLAALLVDTKFNVRREFVSRARLAVDDLERARALLSGTQTGHFELSLAELEHVVARADFAAAELRTVRSDLLALAPQPGDRSPEADELAAAKHLGEVARGAREPARTEQLAAALAPRDELESKMRKLLFSSDAEPRLAALRDWRDRTLATAAAVRARVLELLPDTPEGERAPADIARLKKTERLGQAFALAVEGTGHDPLDAELAWAAGHARHFSWPGLESVSYFDRFLALSGVRTSDANPASGRKLTPREQEAFTAVVSFRR